MQQATVNLFADMGAQPGDAAVRPRGRDRVDRHHRADGDDHRARRRRVADGIAGDDHRHRDRHRRRRRRRRRGVDRRRHDLAPGDRARRAGPTRGPPTATRSTTIKVARRRRQRQPADARRRRHGQRRPARARSGARHRCPPPTPTRGDPTRGRGRRQVHSPTRFGTITGLRFYKAAANTGTHIGSLWSGDGQRLAQATFTRRDGAPAGRRSRSPRRSQVTPDTTYVASYYAPNGHYSADGGLLLPHPAPGPNGGGTPTARRCTRIRNTGTADQRRLHVRRLEHVPDQQLRRGQLLGRRLLHADAGARARSPA